MADNLAASHTSSSGADGRLILESRRWPDASGMKLAALAGVLGTAAFGRSLPADLRPAIRDLEPDKERGFGRCWAAGQLTCDAFPGGVFVKAFWPLVFYNGVRAIVAKPVLRRAGIRAPELLATALVIKGSTTLLATCEALCPGTPYRHVAWSEAAARSLGIDIARWHEIELSRYESAIFRAPLFHPPGLAFWHDVAQVAGAYGESVKSIVRHLAKLQDRNFVGRVALCQWDLGGGNILVESDGRLSWVDLDRTVLSPVYANLADALVRLAETPEGRTHIELVLAAYFDNRPDDFRAWRRARIDWLRIRTAIDLLNVCWWVPHGVIPLTQTPGKRLAQTIAALTLEDDGGTTANLWARFDSHRRAIHNELGLDGWLIPEGSA